MSSLTGSGPFVQGVSEDRTADKTILFPPGDSTPSGGRRPTYARFSGSVLGGVSSG